MDAEPCRGFTSPLAASIPRLSVGIDSVRIDEVAGSLTRFGSRYLDRVFTRREQDACTGEESARARSLAARFAAKEAAYKALRPADLAGPWTAVEVLRDQAGRPSVTLHGAAAEHARRNGIQDLSVSMTHDGELATAIVVALADSVGTISPPDIAAGSPGTPGPTAGESDRSCPRK